MTPVWDQPEHGGGVTRRQMLCAGVGAMAAGGFLAGCGGSGGSGGGGRMAVRVINSSATDQLALQRMLERGGYYEKHGVSVKTTNVQSGADVTAGLASGSAELTMLSGLSGIMPALEKGLPLKILGGTQVVSTNALFTKRARIKSIADLRGASLGVGAVGAELYDVFVAILEKEGIPKSAVTFRNVGSSANSFSAAMAGTVDVGYGDVGDQAIAKAHGARMIATCCTVLPLWITSAAVASESAIHRNREALVRVMAAYGDLFKYLTRPASKAAYVSAYVGSGGDAASGALSWQFINRHTAFSPTFALPERKLGFIQEQNLKAGSQSRVVPFAKATDLSIAKAAVTGRSA